MSAESFVSRDVLASLVHHPKVESGEWVTPYHLYEGWQLFKVFPEKYGVLFDTAMKTYHPQPFWFGEGFIHRSEREVDVFTFSLNSQGPTPQKIPLFGKPSLKVDKLIPDFLKYSGFKDPSRFRKQYPHLTSTSRNHLFIPVVTWVDEDKEVAQVVEEIIDLDRPPTYSFWLALMPFHFFDRRKQNKVVGDDPFRMIFQLGIETAQLPVGQT